MAATMGGMGAPHRPVLLRETIELLRPDRGGTFVDCTVGTGGHAEAILNESTATSVIGIDRDSEALGYAAKRLACFGARFKAVHGDFRELEKVVRRLGAAQLNGVLADLGVSSLQFDSETRGFSFRHDAPLDMRMNRESDDPTAADLLERLPGEEIARILYEFGEERRSRLIARRIVEQRERGHPVKTTKELASLIERALGRRPGAKIHPATRTFQALRIAVNRELEGLEEFLEKAISLIRPDGRVVVISFHSLEDRIVKRTFRRLSGICECGSNAPVCSCRARELVEILTKRPIVPSKLEIDSNPRARSAKLRACRKLA